MKQKAGTLLVIFMAYAVLQVNSQAFSEQVTPFIKIPAGTIVLTGVKIIDGTGSAAKENQSVLIRGDRIAAIGNAKDISIPANATILNCSGKTLIPGLVMLHEHLYYTSPLEAFFNISEMPFTFPRLYLAAGVTTMRTG